MPPRKRKNVDGHTCLARWGTVTFTMASPPLNRVAPIVLNPQTPYAHTVTRVYPADLTMRCDDCGKTAAHLVYLAGIPLIMSPLITQRADVELYDPQYQPTSHVPDFETPSAAVLPEEAEPTPAPRMLKKPHPIAPLYHLRCTRSWEQQPEITAETTKRVWSKYFIGLKLYAPPRNFPPCHSYDDLGVLYSVIRQKANNRVRLTYLFYDLMFHGVFQPDGQIFARALMPHNMQAYSSWTLAQNTAFADLVRTRPAALLTHTFPELNLFRVPLDPGCSAHNLAYLAVGGPPTEHNSECLSAVIRRARLGLGNTCYTAGDPRLRPKTPAKRARHQAPLEPTPLVVDDGVAKVASGARLVLQDDRLLEQGIYDTLRMLPPNRVILTPMLLGHDPDEVRQEILENWLNQPHAPPQLMVWVPSRRSRPGFNQKHLVVVTAQEKELPPVPANTTLMLYDMHLFDTIALYRIFTHIQAAYLQVGYPRDQFLLLLVGKPFLVPPRARISPGHVFKDLARYYPRLILTQHRPQVSLCPLARVPGLAMQTLLKSIDRFYEHLPPIFHAHTYALAVPAELSALPMFGSLPFSRDNIQAVENAWPAARVQLFFATHAHAARMRPTLAQKKNWLVCGRHAMHLATGNLCRIVRLARIGHKNALIEFTSAPYSPLLTVTLQEDYGEVDVPAQECIPVPYCLAADAPFMEPVDISLVFASGDYTCTDLVTIAESTRRMVIFMSIPGKNLHQLRAEFERTTFLQSLLEA